MAKLFVSYSRKDSVAARKLIEAFKSMGQDVWVDWEAIPPAVDWLEQIFRGIEEADAFIFMISPDSIASEVCKVEIGRAVLNNKRIIPIVLRDVSPKDTIEDIRKLNWTFIRETDNLEEGLAKVKTAIELDLDWLEEHRRLQVRALEWHRKKDPSLLLRGRDLRNARHMLQTYTSKDPIPTDLQSKYIEFSERTERTRNIMVVLTAVTLFILLVLTIYAANQTKIAVAARDDAFNQRVTAQVAATEAIKQKGIAVDNAATAKANELEANKQRKRAEINQVEAEAQRSAARAQIYQSRPGELYTSTLYAIDSLQKEPTSAEAEEILRKNISLLPIPVAPQITKQGKINALAYSPAGETFATASADGTTCAWNVTDGENIFCTEAGQPVTVLAFSPDGTLIVTGDQSGLVQILDVTNKGNILNTYQRVKPQPGQSDVQIADKKNSTATYEPLASETPVRGVSFTPNGQQVAVAYEDRQIPVFNWKTGAVSARLSTGSIPNVFGMSPRGPWLVAGTKGGSVSFWNLGNKEDRFTPAEHKGGVTALAFSPDNTKVASAGNDNTVAIISPRLKKQLARIATQSSVRSLAFSPNGKWIVTAADDHRIRIWDTEDGSELLGMSQDGAVTDVVYSPNGQWLATTGEDKTTRVWDAATGAEIFQIPQKAGGAALAFSNDGQYLISTDQSGAIDIWALSTLASRLQYQPFNRAVENVQYSPSGERIAISSENRVFLLRLDPESGLIPLATNPLPLPIKSNVKEIVFSPDSKFLGVTTDGKEVAFYDIEKNTPRSDKVASNVISIAFSPDNQRFLASSAEGTIQAWDVNSGKAIDTAAQEYPPASSLASSSKFLASGAKDKISVSDPSGGGKIDVQAPGANTLLALNQDGSWLASTDSTGQIRIWKYQDGKFTSVPATAEGQTTSPLIKEQAASLAFNPTGTRLAVGTANYVFLIDTASGKEIARIPYRDAVTDLSFSGDGKYLTTASSRFVERWEIGKIEEIESNDLIQTACSRLANKVSDTLLKSFSEPLCNNVASQ